MEARSSEGICYDTGTLWERGRSSRS